MYPTATTYPFQRPTPLPLFIDLFAERRKISRSDESTAFDCDNDVTFVIVKNSQNDEVYTRCRVVVIIPGARSNNLCVPESGVRSTWLRLRRKIVLWVHCHTCSFKLLVP